MTEEFFKALIGMCAKSLASSFFRAITLFFFSLAVVNFIVLVAIVVVLGIGPEGLSSVEFLPQDGSIKFLKDVLAPDITLSGVIRLESCYFVLLRQP